MSAVVRALGPWVLLRRQAPEHEWWSIEGLTDGLYHADGTGGQRVTFGRGVVVSVGRGYYSKPDEKTGKVRLVQPDSALVEGAVAVYRGYLEKALQPFELDDPDLFFVHMDSIDGVEDDGDEEDLDAAGADGSEQIDETELEEASIGLSEETPEKGEPRIILGTTISKDHTTYSSKGGSALIAEIARKQGI